MFQLFVYTVQLYSCLSVNVYKKNITFWGYCMIYLSETIRKVEARRQSEAITQACHAASFPPSCS
jgi:hypothetical protein